MYAANALYFLAGMASVWLFTDIGLALLVIFVLMPIVYLAGDASRYLNSKRIRSMTNNKEKSS